MIHLVPHPPAIVIAQSSPYVQDIPGWNGTSWGVSQSDVQKIFPQMRTENSEKMSGSYDLDGVTCEVLFNFDAGKLSAVNLKYTGERFRTNAYRFSGLLKSKYGDPTQKHENLAEAGLVYYEWLLQTTEIRLSMFSANEVAAENWVDINYSARKDRNDI